MRLIDADALAAVLSERTRPGHHPQYILGALDCVTLVNDAPTVAADTPVPLTTLERVIEAQGNGLVSVCGECLHVHKLSGQKPCCWCDDHYSRWEALR